MSIFTTLQRTNIPCVFSHFKTENAPKNPPYVAYLGNGQNTMIADNSIYWRENTYQVEYYFSEKNEEMETAFEDVLIGDGWIYEKSEDTYIESEGVFLIYYSVTRGEKGNG